MKSILIHLKFQCNYSLKKHQWKSIGYLIEIPMKYQWKSIGNQVAISMKYQYKSIGNPVKIHLEKINLKLEIENWMFNRKFKWTFEIHEISMKCL